MYTLLFNHVVGVSVADNSFDTAPLYLSKENIAPVGFDDNDNLLEYSKRSFSGYRLLTEFFSFSKKYMFFDVTGLGKKLKGRGQKIELFFYLNVFLFSLILFFNFLLDLFNIIAVIFR